MEFTTWSILAFVIAAWVIALSTYEYFNKNKKRTAKIEELRIDIGQIKTAFELFKNAFEVVQKDVEKLEHRVGENYKDIANIENKFDSVLKTSEEAKKMLNQMSLVQAFVPRTKRTEEIKKSN